MRRILACVPLAWLGVALVAAANPEPAAKVGADCTAGGKVLKGRVKVVDAFPDLRVKRVDAFEDFWRVQWVDAFPDRCGRWQRVDAFPDFTIEYVDAFPDITIRTVDALAIRN